MDMQELQSPVFGAEDPSLPWPDSDDMVLTLRSEPVVAASASCAPDDGCGQDQRQGHRHEKWHEQRYEQRHHDRDQNKRRDEGRRGDMEQAEHGRTERPSCDSIDPRLLSLAMAFVPYQPWEEPYDYDVGLKRGTIFPSLDMPWTDEEAWKR